MTEGEVDTLPRRQSPWLLEAALMYLEAGARRGWAAATLANDRSTLLRFAAHMGQRRLASIRPDEIVAWLEDNSRRWAPGTTNRNRMTLVRFWRWATDKGWTAVEWFHLFPPLPLPQPEKTFLSAGELLSLLAHAKIPRDRAMLAVAMNSALRSIEIRRLRLSAVDFGRNRLRIEIAKKRRLVVDFLKLSAELRSELEAWLAVYAEECGQLDPDWYLIPAMTPPRYSGPDQLGPGLLKPSTQLTNENTIIRRIFERSGLNIPTGEAWHLVRRSVAMLYFQDVQRRDPYADALGRTQALLHHASRQQTEVYLDLTAAKAARDADLDNQPFLTRLANGGNSGEAAGHSAVVRSLRQA